MDIFFYLLIRSRSSFEYLDRCLDSVLRQNYTNYKILFIDDASGYSTVQINHIKNKLKGHICVFNKVRKYSIYNAYYLIHKYADNGNAIVFNLDGDDWLYHNNVLSDVSNTYKHNPYCQLTYGDCLIWNGKGLLKSSLIYPLINTYYPKNVVDKKLYRQKPFLPLHPRTWHVNLFKKIKVKDFQDANGKWLRFAEDQAMYFPMLEMANGNYKVIKKPLYVYNTATNKSDVKENILGLIKDELVIRKKSKYESID